VVLPTDTVYGIAALAADEAAVARVYAAKGRAPDKRLPLLIAGPAELERLADRVPACAGELTARHWPGALTVVVQASSDVGPWLVDERGTIAVRCPAHRFVRELARLVGPLAATSANMSGDPDPRSVDEVPTALARAADLVVDGGPTPGVASTVVDCTGERPAVLRPGAVDPSDPPSGP
jgi:tRNA threonylcarbamoyl adenosine modification protein (Sua5/YciO/YrdC/YwlC family)